MIIGSTSPFRVVAYAATGVVKGEVANVISVDNTVSLDRAGVCRFSLPVLEPSARYITPGTYFDIFDEVDGYIGRYTYSTASIALNDNQALMNVTCNDGLDGLRRLMVGFRRNYPFTPVDEVVEDLLLVAGWTAIVDPSIGNTSVTFEGESVLNAIDVLRDRWGVHFRLGQNPNELEFGAFGQSTGVLFQRLSGQVQPLIYDNENTVHVTSLVKSIDVDEVYNRIIPIGGGQGEAEITIQGSTVGAYPVQTGTNEDGTNYYYIQDDESIELYGLRERVAKMTGIRPLSNNDTDIERARNAVKYAGETYLRRHREPRFEYSVRVINLHGNVRVGDKVRLIYNSDTLTDSSLVSVNEELYVMDIDYSRSVRGQRSANVTLCTVDQRRTTDTDVVVDVIRDVEVLKLHIQPYPYWSENTWLDTIQGFSSTSSREYKRATFKIEIDNSVTKLTKVRIRFKSRPLYTTMYFNGTANPAIGDAIYQVVNSLNYPYFIRCYVNGVDVSSQLGGAWATSLPATAIDVSADITDIIKAASGGIYQDHIIEFSAENTTGGAGVGNPPTLTNLISNGFIELNVRIQGIAQGIVPT